MVVFFGLGLLAGVVLLRAGLRRRRRGLTPHCARCDYNLTGLVSDRCPECGTAVSESPIVFGELHRRPGLIVLGGLLFALTALYFIAASRGGQVDWYRHYPTLLVLRDARSSSQGTVTRAWSELNRRLQNGEISAGRRTDLIDLALKVQTAPSPCPHRDDALDCLARYYIGGRLTQAQQDALFKQMTALQLLARPRVVDGDDARYRLSHQTRSPGGSYAPGQFWIELSFAELRLDGKVVRKGRLGGSSSSGSGGAGSSGGSVPCKGLGHHTLAATATIKVFLGTFNNTKASKPCYQGNIPLEASFEVLKPETGDPIRLINDPSARNTLESCITPSGFMLGEYEAGRLSGEIKIEAPPVPVCFDVFARVGNTEYPLGSIDKARGESTNWGVSGSKCPVVPFDKCDIILRSSPRSARRTIDLYEIWSGELVYKDVPVTAGPYATSQPTTARTAATKR